MNKKWQKFLSSVLAGVSVLTMTFSVACGTQPCAEHTAATQRKTTAETHSIVCKDCGEELLTQAHTFGAWHTRTAATCTTAGEEYAICAGCAYMMVRPIEATGHQTIVYQTTATTHTAYCDDCDTVQSQAQAHDFGGWVETSAATCEVAGGKKRVCGTCNFVEYATIETIAHTPKETYQYNDTQHWKDCSVCNTPIATTYENHVMNGSDCICGYHVPTVEELVDFVVEVPTGREPVVLQLTDTQFIDAGQARPDRTGVHWGDWATGMMEENGFAYLRETITAVQPDLIIMTGDLVYGEFDDNGSVWTRFVDFMDSFDIPWAPIFGNHDNESAMGVDWQCEQLMKAENCLFEQRTLTGNGNYSVGIMQGGQMIRAFYMLDTNACGNASAASKANGHTRHDFVGFGQDQIDWYTESITRLHDFSPATKISFGYHIQSWVVTDAYAKYGCDSTTKSLVNIDQHPNKAEGDFGILQTNLKGEWDRDGSIFNAMKALGVDSIFLGHEHDVSASVMYQGVRIQFGQKCTAYDTHNWVDATGKLSTSAAVEVSKGEGKTPLIGGSVIKLGTDGAINNAYIYLCQNAGGNIQWN